MREDGKCTFLYHSQTRQRKTVRVVCIFRPFMREWPKLRNEWNINQRERHLQKYTLSQIEIGDRNKIERSTDFGFFFHRVH